jgi:hypothetical protein
MASVMQPGAAVQAIEDRAQARVGVRRLLSRRVVVLESVFLIAVSIGAWFGQMGLLAGWWSPVAVPRIDFVVVWAASSLALDGAASQAYVPARILEAQRELPAGATGLDFWRYPPIAFLFVLPLALLPFVASLAVWVLATGGLAFSAVRRIASNRWPVMLAALAFPGTFWNAYSGQNGLLTAGLLAWGMVLLRDRPVAAGVMLGLIAYKPQFLPLVLVALIAGRELKAAAAALACAGALAVSSLAIFGPEAWEGFFEVARVSSESVYAGEVPIAKMQSVLAGLLVIGVPEGGAQAAQAVVTLGAAGFVAWLWRGGAPFEYKAAGLALAALIASPYSYLYDLTLLGLAALWLGLRLEKEGWQRWDAEVLLLAWLSPLSFAVLGLSIGALVSLMMVGLLILRVRRRNVRAGRLEMQPSPV